MIFWLQTALGGTALGLVTALFPETIPFKNNEGLEGKSILGKARVLYDRVSPVRVCVLLFSYPNLACAGLSAGALVWNQYSLLTPIRYVLNPRFHLTSPIQSGLFYLAPGGGYVTGTFFGGRWADYIVRKWIRKRNGVRIPEDRLKSCLVFMIVSIPGWMLIYGWTVDRAVGGIPVPVIAMFLQGVSQLFCFPSLNTYCLDVMQAKGRSAEVVAGNYLTRYVFAAVGSGVVLPAVEAIGIGWFSTISALFLVFSGCTVWLTALYGPKWREAVDRKREEKDHPSSHDDDEKEEEEEEGEDVEKVDDIERGTKTTDTEKKA